MKKILIVVLILTFMTVNAEPFTDDMANLKGAFKYSNNVVCSLIPPAQYDEFYDDYTIMQRSDKEDAFITYNLEYLKSAEVTAYFYKNSSIDEIVNDFIFYLSSDDKNYEEVIPTKEHTEAKDGKWHKVVYKFENPKVNFKYLKIRWADITGTNFTNWGQALGKITVEETIPAPFEVKFEGDCEMVIPDEGINTYPLTAKVYDQMDKVMKNTPIAYKAINLPEGVTFDDATGILSVGTEATDLAVCEIDAFTADNESVKTGITITLKKIKPGDLNGDLIIDEKDLTELGENFMKTSIDEVWPKIKRGDINENEIIDIYDIAYTAKNIYIIPAK